MHDWGFWWEFAGKVGAPLVAGAVVAALLQGRFEAAHGAIIAGGVALLFAEHWRHSR
jgi:hypothetical protein